ncbi:MAG: hypothetical protein E6H66_03855 [Betaproteobacteria bacterium]|nr:MAG: hypothetical protein E6H66_03855 [Betaproteobacteria bacterium]
MSYVLELKDRPGFLHAKVSGINSTTAVIEYTHDIHKACVERRCRALLIEENLAGPSIDMSSIFQVAADRSRQAVGILKWIAYVDVNPEHDRSRMKFAEDVAVGRGANMRLFDSVADAERWLHTHAESAQ